jgi:hypothetical protein
LIFGHGAPNIPNGELEILASDNSVLGTGGTDGAGNFISNGMGIPVTPLTGGQKIFAADLQHGVSGPQVIVLGSGQVPDLNVWGAGFLGLSLLVVTAVRLRRAARTATAQSQG